MITPSTIPLFCLLGLLLSFIAALIVSRSSPRFWKFSLISIILTVFILLVFNTVGAIFLGPFLGAILGGIIKDRSTSENKKQPQKIYSKRFLLFLVLICGSIGCIILIHNSRNPISTSQSSPKMLVHIDGYAPDANITLPYISIWTVPDDDLRKFEFSCTDGESVICIGTKIDENGRKWIHIQTMAGMDGWVKAWFIKEFK